MSEVLNVEEMFGQNVFNLTKMRERLPKNVYKEVLYLLFKQALYANGADLSLDN